MSVGNAKKGVKKNRGCPSCKSGQVVPIVYGLPGVELAKQAEEGLIGLGGCCVDDDNPGWMCKACEHEW